MREQLDGIELVYPFWLLLFPLPFLIIYLLPVYRTKQPAIKVPFFEMLAVWLGETPRKGSSSLKRSWWQKVTLFLSWILIVFAMSKPVMMGAPQIREQIGRDVMVVVDLSGSMAEEDFTDAHGKSMSRLDAAKQVLSEFVKTRSGDRLGLILFGDAAFVQAPFTADHQVWLTLLNQTEVAMAGSSTHLGDAIGLAIKLFSQEEALALEQGKTRKRDKVAIVLTDGNDTESLVPPLDAAKVAKAKAVRIHIIAMGNPETVGEQAIDLALINRIATASGGEAFEAQDRQALSRAYQAISQLEESQYESTTYRPKVGIYHYLVMMVLVINLTALTVASIIGRSVNKERTHV